MDRNDCSFNMRNDVGLRSRASSPSPHGSPRTLQQREKIGATDTVSVFDIDKREPEGAIIRGNAMSRVAAGSSRAIRRE